MILRIIRKIIRGIKYTIERSTNWAERDKYEKRYLSVGNNKAKIRSTGIISNPKESKVNIRIGSNVMIDGIVQSFQGTGKIEIGDFSYIGPNSRIWAYESLKIGNHVLISHNCNVFDSNCHPTDYLERRRDYENILFHGGGNQNGEVDCAPVVIEDDVWIGANSCVMKGVTIGARSIVAAGSVVTKSVPEDVIVAGNPAHIVKYLAKDELFNNEKSEK